MATTIETMLLVLPTLTARQVVDVVVADSPHPGLYSLTFEDGVAEYTSPGGETPADVRDGLLAALADATAIVTGAAHGDDTLRVSGAQWGVAFTMAIDYPDASMSQTTVTAASGVPQLRLDYAINIAARLVVRSAWGTLYADALALRALHWLARTGALAELGELGEAGPLASAGLGPSSAAFAVATSPTADPDLASTRFGRMFAELFESIRPTLGLGVLR